MLTANNDVSDKLVGTDDDGSVIKDFSPHRKAEMSYNRSLCGQHALGVVCQFRMNIDFPRSQKSI